MSNYECQDCGREHLSINAMMNCPCDRYDHNGYPKTVKGGDWID